MVNNVRASCVEFEDENCSKLFFSSKIPENRSKNAACSKVFQFFDQSQYFFMNPI